MKRRTVLAACAILCGLVAALLAPGIVHADVGIKGRAYTAGTSGPPTTSKPESKLWFNDGFWWAVMVTPTNNDYHIFRLNLRKQTWVDTGVAVDTRASTRQDVLSTGSKLFVASHKFVPVSHEDPTPGPTDDMRLSRFSYNAGADTYSLDGVASIDPQKSETLVIDQDSTGAIWATWVQESGGSHQVYVKKSDGNCVSDPAFVANCSFTAGAFTLDPNVAPDDISSIVRFGGNKVGVMWSDQTTGELRFSVHNDADAFGTWQPSEVVTGSPAAPKFADDHINLKADSAGRVYAVTKTKFAGPSKPGTVLQRRSATGNWTSFTVSAGSLDRTRPIVILDPSHNRILVFEGTTQGSAVFLKTSHLNHISFPASQAGKRVIADTGSTVSNPTSTKQNVSNATRLIVLATNPTTKHYWHAYFQIIPCIKGTGGNNTMVGTRGNDALCALGGNDTLKGLAGKDRLVGGKGNDTFIARDAFRDVLSGGPGHDRAHVNASDVRHSIEVIF
jgi:RTX calcium-binding nonapeptide repeat (4 copies)